MRFKRHRHYVNLSRASPLELHTVYTAHDGSKSQLYADRRIAVCLSAVLVVDSHLLSPTDCGLRNKFIKGTLHQQEMQRFVGATCMVFGHGPLLHAQIERDSMVFGTMGLWRSGLSTSSSHFGFLKFLLLAENKPESGAHKHIRAAGILGKAPSALVPHEKRRNIKPILDVTDVGKYSVLFVL